MLLDLLSGLVPFSNMLFPWDKYAAVGVIDGWRLYDFPSYSIEVLSHVSTVIPARPFRAELNF